MSRIYIASSWKNGVQPVLVSELRKRGHKVYDFRHPAGRNDKNVWEAVTLALGLFRKWKQSSLSTMDFIRMLRHKEAMKRFNEHFAAMSDADTCILLLPCGRSAHCEAGYMAGVGKRVFVMDISDSVQPELMYLMFDRYFDDYDKLYEALDEPVAGVCRICGCSLENPCYHPGHGYCSWVEPSLCSHCASVCEGVYGIKDDPQTEHCVKDLSDAYK